MDLSSLIGKGGQWQGRLEVSSTNNKLRVLVNYELPAGLPAGEVTLHAHLMFNDFSPITPVLVSIGIVVCASLLVELYFALLCRTRTNLTPLTFNVQRYS